MWEDYEKDPVGSRYKLKPEPHVQKRDHLG